MKLRHVMIDLETMGLRPNAAIVSIGAVIFDPRYGKKADGFYTELAWRQQCRNIDSGTKEWWGKQNPKAKKALSGTAELGEQLEELAFWLPNDCKVWGNGPTFDISILEDAYIQHDIEIPWKFWNVRDCRTIKDLYESARGGFDKKSGGTLHNALDDAQYQADYVIEMWNKILNSDKGEK